MKTIKRKLLSLVLAMAMVLTLAPTALAVEYTATINVASKLTLLASGTVSTNATVGLSQEAITDGFSISECSWTVDGVAVTGDKDGAELIFTSAKTYSVGVSGKATKPASTDGTIPAAEATFSGTTPVKVNPYVAPTAANLAVGAASPSTLTAGGSTTASVTVTVTAADGTTPVPNADVTVDLKLGSTATGATASVSNSGKTAADGKATITVSPGSVAGTATFSVSAGAGAGLNKEFSITVNPPVTAVTVVTSGNATSLAAGSTLSVMATTGVPAVGTYDTITWSSSNTSVLTVAGTTANATITGVAAGKATVSVEYKKGTTVVAKGTSAEITVTGAPTVYIGVGNSTAVATTYSLAGVGSEATLYVYVNGSTNQYQNYTYNWSVYSGTSVDLSTGMYSNTYYQTVRGVSVGTTYIDVTVYQAGTTTIVDTARIAVTVGNSGLQASATVYGGSDYRLSDIDDNGKSSVVSQIEQMVRNSSLSRYLNYVVFTSTTSIYGDLSANTYTNYYADGISSISGGRLSDVVFSPKQAGTAYFSFRAYYYNGTNYGTPGVNDYITGTLAITVSNTISTGDITYSASIGADVPFALRDFEDFYYNKTRGSLSYVTFTLPSGGSLYADGGRLNSSNACYASPGRSQTDLAGVYFSPTGTTATRANTVRINFTAYGNRTNASGTVAITYLAGSAKDITYSVSNSAALKISDFTDAYRQVVGSTAPTGLTIEFQSAPTNGTLSYKDSSRTNSSAVTLRSGNIKSYKFTTRTTGTNQLSDVTYTANGNRSDTIEYIAYVNSTPQFTGKVVFNGANTSAATMQIGFTSTNGQAVAFSYAEFVKENAVIMASTSYIRFVTMPTGGTLSYNGSALTLSSTNVLPANLGSVTYRPNAGFNNSTDRVSFLCYDVNGNSVGGGQVSIIVTGNTAGSVGATTVDSFKDVSSTAWYRTDLITLVNAGIIQGRGDGKFDPTAELTYGEALKIFMLASGSSKLDEPSGKNWAINYRSAAARNGWISDSVDLNAKISRNAMAELAAKSLGVSPTTNVPPVWTDGTSSTYSNALYYTNPQILIGNADGTFKGNDTLKRQEICAIAARVLNYRSGQQSVDKPSWLG